MDTFADTDEALHEDVHCIVSVLLTSDVYNLLLMNSLNGAKITNPIQYAVTASSEPTCDSSSQAKAGH